MSSPMTAIKRKFDEEEDLESPCAPTPKRPAVEPAQTMDVEISSQQHHLVVPTRTRFNSTASWSTTSSHSPTPSLSSLPSSPAGLPGHDLPSYPSSSTFPFPSTPSDSNSMDIDMPHSTTPRPIGSNEPPEIAMGTSSLFLPMPQQSGFTHLRDSCTQIPKLRVSNHAGLTGERTLWTVCEQCGAAEMFRGCGGSSDWNY